jgi:hypothetical protein
MTKAPQVATQKTDADMSAVTIGIKGLWDFPMSSIVRHSDRINPKAPVTAIKKRITKLP